MIFDEIFTIDKEVSKDEFLRKVLIELASSEKTAVDVVKSNFKEVEETTREVLLCSCHVETDYTASVGYDREEQYWVKETKRDSNGNSYEENVLKTRTVTDWHPHSGHIDGDSVKAVFNDASDEELDGEEELMLSALKDAKEESISTGGGAAFNSEAFEKAKQYCCWSVHYQINFPGDHHKNENYNDNVTVKSVTCYIMPFYTIKFTYKGRTYQARGFACGNPAAITEIPEANVNIVRVAKNLTKGSKKLKIASWSVFGGMFLLSIILDIVGFYWLWIVTLLLLVASIIIHVMADKKYISTLRMLKRDNIKLKKNALLKALSEKGYEKLNSVEEDLFDVTSQTSDFTLRNKPKGVKLPAILCSIATVILMIASIIASSKAGHSPKTVSVEIVSKYYINDNNFDLVYSLESTKYGVDSISLETTVYRNDSELGYLTTNFSNLNLEKGSTITQRVNFSTSYPDSFFLTMSRGNLEDFDFSYKITYINFTDGQIYSGN